MFCTEPEDTSTEQDPVKFYVGDFGQFYEDGSLEFPYKTVA